MNFYNYVGLSAFALLVMASDCSGTTSPKPSDPRPTPIVTDSDYCDLAEANLLAKEGTPMAKARGVNNACDDGKPTKKGKSFAQFCRETQQNGIAIYPKCLSKIDSCDQIDRVTSSGICPIPEGTK